MIRARSISRGAEFRTPAANESANNVAALTSGTPLWASLLLSIGAVISTHFLTRWRDRTRSQDDELSRWRGVVESSLESITQAAISHYCDTQSLGSTLLSSQRILIDLKRLDRKLFQFRCSDSSCTATARNLLTRYHQAITLPDDFQDPNRSLRPANDAVIGEIAELEGLLRDNLKLRRKVVKT